MNRVGFIGGSDMRRIMNGDWISLWKEKTKRKEPDDLSGVLPVQLGIYTEQFNIDWFAKDMQISIPKENLQREFTLNWEGVPLKGTVDAQLDSHEILECKHTFDANTMESCIKMYMPQIQFYLWVSNSKGCYLSVLFGNRKWDYVFVHRDFDYIEKMKVYVKEFWQLVRDDEIPFGDDEVSPVSIDKIKVNGMVRRDASGDNEFISRCHDYIEKQESAASFESAKSDLKAMVGDNEREVYCDLLTIKRDKRGALRITIKEEGATA